MVVGPAVVVPSGVPKMGPNEDGAFMLGGRAGGKDRAHLSLCRTMQVKSKRAQAENEYIESMGARLRYLLGNNIKNAGMEEETTLLQF